MLKVPLSGTQDGRPSGSGAAVRSLGMTRQNEPRERFGLPNRVFLYTLDQVALMLDLDLSVLKKRYLHYEGRSVGVRAHDKMEAKNIAPDGDKPDWRIAEPEFIRWMRYKGFRVYNRGWTSR